VNFIGELEAPQRDPSDENDVIQISLYIFRGEFMQLDDSGHLPGPAPRLEDTSDPTTRNLDGLNASVLSEDPYGLVGHVSESGHFRLWKVVDLTPQGRVDEVLAALETVALELLPAMPPMGTCV